MSVEKGLLRWGKVDRDERWIDRGPPQRGRAVVVAGQAEASKSSRQTKGACYGSEYVSKGDEGSGEKEKWRKSCEERKVKRVPSNNGRFLDLQLRGTRRS